MIKLEYPKSLSNLFQELSLKRIVRYALLGLAVIFIAAILANSYILWKYYRIAVSSREPIVVSHVIVNRSDLEKVLEIITTRELLE